MNTWTPLFKSLINSSIWTQADKDTKVLWITMLAIKDQDGFVRSTIPGLAKDSGLTLAEVEKSLKVLSSPDKYSNNQDYEGRRIKKMEGGWLVLNHLVYREMIGKEWRKQYKRQKEKEYRVIRKKHKGPTNSETQAVKNYEDGKVDEHFQSVPEGTNHFKEDPLPYAPA